MTPAQINEFLSVSENNVMPEHNEIIGPGASKTLGLSWVELERVAAHSMSYTRLPEFGGMNSQG